MNQPPTLAEYRKLMEQRTRPLTDRGMVRKAPTVLPERISPLPRSTSAERTRASRARQITERYDDVVIVEVATRASRAHEQSPR